MGLILDPKMCEVLRKSTVFVGKIPGPGDATDAREIYGEERETTRNDDLI